jgi:hypothetical protein
LHTNSATPLVGVRKMHKPRTRSRADCTRACLRLVMLLPPAPPPPRATPQPYVRMLAPPPMTTTTPPPHAANGLRCRWTASTLPRFEIDSAAPTVLGRQRAGVRHDNSAINAAVTPALLGHCVVRIHCDFELLPCACARALAPRAGGHCVHGVAGGGQRGGDQEHAQVRQPRQAHAQRGAGEPCSTRFF